jgi:hypothetical protein
LAKRVRANHPLRQVTSDCRLLSNHSCELLLFSFYLLTFWGCSLLVNVKC